MNSPRPHSSRDFVDTWRGVGVVGGERLLSKGPDVLAGRRVKEAGAEMGLGSLHEVSGDILRPPKQPLTSHSGLNVTDSG